MGLYCYACHNFRNKFKAVVRNRLTEKESEIEYLKAQNEGRVMQTHKIVGYLCKKCSIKAVDAVKNRPFGMGWRDAFKWCNDPKAIQTWKDQRLEKEILE